MLKKKIWDSTYSIEERVLYTIAMIHNGASDPLTECVFDIPYKYICKDFFPMLQILDLVLECEFQPLDDEDKKKIQITH